MYTGIGKIENLTVIGHSLHWTVSFVSSDVTNLSYSVTATLPNTSTAVLPITVVDVPSYDLATSMLPVCDPYVFFIHGVSALYTGASSSIFTWLPKSILIQLLVSYCSFF